MKEIIPADQKNDQHKPNYTRTYIKLAMRDSSITALSSVRLVKSALLDEDSYWLAALIGLLLLRADAALFRQLCIYTCSPSALPSDLAQQACCFLNR